MRKLLHRRSGEPGDMHRVRPPAPGRTAHPRRAVVFTLSHACGPDLLALRPEDTVRPLPYHRSALLPGLPTPIRCLHGLRPPRTDRVRHPDRAALRELHHAAGLAVLPDLQRP